MFQKARVGIDGNRVPDEAQQRKIRDGIRVGVTLVKVCPELRGEGDSFFFFQRAME